MGPTIGLRSDDAHVRRKVRLATVDTNPIGIGQVDIRI